MPAKDESGKMARSSSPVGTEAQGATSSVASVGFDTEWISASDPFQSEVWNYAQAR